MEHSTHVSTDIGRWAMVPLWLVKRLTAEPNGTAALTTFIALHQWIDRGKECHPSVGSIAAVAGTSEPTVRRGLRLLEEIGAVVSHPRWTEDGDRTSNRYTLRYVERVTGDETSSQIRQDPPSQSRQDPPSQIRQGKKNHSEVEPVEEDHSLAHASVSTIDGGEFAAFWQAYPRKVGKAAAQRNWARLKPEQRAAALEAVELHAQRWATTRTEPRFIPHPATWLSHGRWDDDLTTEPVPGRSAPTAVLHAATLMREALEREQPRRSDDLVARALAARSEEMWEDTDE